MKLPILYTFIRCPWAMRARLALEFMGIAYETREVDLKNKPASLLRYSPKATVPVLIFTDGTIIEESLDIIFWAMPKVTPNEQIKIDELINLNDEEFKYNIYRYKYPERYENEGRNQQYYRTQGEVFLQVLEDKLAKNKYLINMDVSIADLAIFPLVRQFTLVDKTWFDNSKYSNLKRWLDTISQSEYFAKAMQKHSIWV